MGAWLDGTGDNVTKKEGMTLGDQAAYTRATTSK